MSSDGPQRAANRREKVSLGNSHMQLEGRLEAQSASTRNDDNLVTPVTQLTSNNTAVTVNGSDVRITTFALLANATSYAFVVNNSKIKAESFVRLSYVTNGGITSGGALTVSAQGAGVATVNIATVTGSGTTAASIRLLVD